MNDGACNYLIHYLVSERLNNLKNLTYTLSEDKTNFLSIIFFNRKRYNQLLNDFTKQ